jgi:hypothetical protein
MSNLEIIDEDDVISVKGNGTFSIKDELKKEGARWRTADKAWTFDKSKTKKTLEQVKTMVSLLTGGESKDEDHEPKVSKRKSENSSSDDSSTKKAKSEEDTSPKKPQRKFYKYEEIKDVIKEAKDLWQEKLKELGENPKPNPVLHGAGVRLFYISEEETIYRPHTIIPIKDEFYRKIANEVCDFIKQKGYNCHVTEGKSDFVEY